MTSRIWTPLTRRTKKTLPESLAPVHSLASQVPEKQEALGKEDATRLWAPSELAPGPVLPVSLAPSTQSGAQMEHNEGQMLA